MFCTNCGHQMNENEDFCPECGTRVVKNNLDNMSNTTVGKDNINLKTNITSNVQNNQQQTLSEQLAKNNPIKPFINNIKNIIKKYKKQLLFGMGILLSALIILVLFNHFVGMEKLSWNKDYNDVKLKYVSPTKIKLGVNFSNKEKVDQIKFSSTCGEINNIGLEVIWDLTDAKGKCEITASYKRKKIKKEYTIIQSNIGKEELYLDDKIDENSDEDLDLDGLTNKQEKEYGTKPLIADSDLDGLDDYYEIFTSKTDPNKKDTDQDGLSDYDEIKLELDPLKADSKGDGIKDGERSLTYTYSIEGLELQITGKGNIASTTVQVNSNTKVSNKLGMIDKLFTFYTDGTMDDAIVTISYTDEELQKNNLNEESLSIYYYNEKKNKYEKIDTKVNKEKKTLTATLAHFSNYVVGDSSLVKEDSTTQVLFILDNSWSMYTNEQYKEITGEEYAGGSGNYVLEGSDSEGLRFRLTSELVTSFSGKGYQIGLSEFRKDYTTSVKIGTEYNKIKTNLSGMLGNFITLSAGTYIGNALKNGISEFSEDADHKYIIILTDGEDTSSSNFESSVIEKATKNDVKICSVGFSSGSKSTKLSNISNATGCKYYSSGDVSGLKELFDNLEVELSDDLVDLDEDGKTDGILVADSGFLVNRDGFSFSNYGSNLSSGGHCYGMATIAQLYYSKHLPLNLSSKNVKNDTSYAYNLNNTYFKNYSNLYDYKLKTNPLKYTFGFRTFDEEIPSDFRDVNDTTLIINEKYKKEMNDSGLYDITKEKPYLNRDQQLEKWGATYKMMESYLLNEDKMQTSKSIYNDDKQIMNAIYAGFIRQNVTTHYSSGSDFVLWLRNVIGTDSIEYKGAQGFINILKTRLENKEAPVISSDFNGGLHAVNAISLVQDIDNPNYYYIGVYDNNYPGEKKYVDIECNIKTCVTKANSYYKGSDEPIRITPSLEYDLEYFK